MEQAVKTQEIQRLQQLKRIALIERPTETSFICVHSFEDLRDGFHRFPFLLPLDKKQDFLSHRSWDMRNDDFTPTVQCEEGFAGGKRQRKVYYLKHGNASGAEALVRTRYYWGTFPAEIEIAEEFPAFLELISHSQRKSQHSTPL
jgi:hypothetical protein